MKLEVRLEHIIFTIVILLLLYAIWFVTKHSEPVSFADLMTFGGVLISGASLLFTLVFTRLSSVENKVDEAIKELHYIKGKIDAEQNKSKEL